jgi:xylulose-5-phosphate/fructose-6-phosphate phosphoketolase
LRILCRVAESFYIGDVQAKLQERAVDRRVRRSRSPTFLPVSSTMTGQSHTVTLKVVFALVWLVLQPQSEHPHGLEDQDFDELFTTDKPVIFAFHGYPAIIHKLTYRRHNHDNIHVRGYKEEGTTTTPFDMVVLNNLDRYQLALDAIQRIPRLRDQVETATARYWTTMERHKLFISEHGDDMPEVRDWRWSL